MTAGQHACLVLVSCGQDRSEDPFSITYVLPQHRSLSTCLATTRESQRILRLRAGKRGRRRLGFGNRTAAAGGDTCARRGTVLTWRACPVPRAPRGRGLRWRGESSRLVGLLGFHLYLKNTPRATAFTQNHTHVHATSSDTPRLQEQEQDVAQNRADHTSLCAAGPFRPARGSQ